MKKKSSGKMKSADKFKEKMPPSKKQQMGKKKQVSGRDYAEDLEEMEAKKGRRSDDDWKKSKPADLAGAFRKSKEGYSKKPRIKPDKMKGKGR